MSNLSLIAKVGGKAYYKPESLIKDDNIVHSYWDSGYNFPDGSYWKCMNCKELVKVRAGAMIYCGHCGAKMDKAGGK